MARQPTIRAAATKDFIEVADHVRAGLHDKICGALPEASRELIDASARIGWLPLDLHMIVLETAREVAGPEVLRPMWRRAMLRSFEAATLRLLVEGAKRMFGLSPRGMVKAAPRGYGLLSRGLGELEVHDEDQSHRIGIALSGFPEQYARSGTFVEGLAGCFESFFDVCKVSGRVVIRDHTADGGLYALTWQ